MGEFNLLKMFLACCFTGNPCSAQIQYELNELKSTVADQKVKLEALQKQLGGKAKL